MTQRFFGCDSGEGPIRGIAVWTPENCLSRYDPNKSLRLVAEFSPATPGSIPGLRIFSPGSHGDRKNAPNTCDLGLIRPTYFREDDRKSENATSENRTSDLQIFGLTLSQLTYRGNTALK